MIKRNRILFLGVLLLVLLSGGCGGGKRDQTATATPTAIPFTVILPTDTPVAPGGEAVAEPTAVVTSTQPTLMPTPTLAAPVGVLNAPKTGGEAGGAWTLVDLRYGLHADRLRIVWEMAEPGQTVPEYRAVEVDNIAAPTASGETADLGVARIDILLNNVKPTQTLQANLPIDFEENPVATKLIRYPTADERRLGFSVGLSQPARFEVHELSGPVRVVLDVFFP